MFHAHNTTCLMVRWQQGGVATGRFPNFDLATLRIMGVLQRISICYFVVSLIAIRVIPGRRELKDGPAASRQPPEISEQATSPLHGSAGALCQVKHSKLPILLRVLITGDCFMPLNMYSSLLRLSSVF